MVNLQLLLSAGGGIRSTWTQVQQRPNTAALFIGLGGTGIDAIRAVKAAVQEHLIPDDPEAPVPAHAHIQFLGVDTDLSVFNRPQNKDDPLSALGKLKGSEFLFLSSAHLHIGPAPLPPELAWFNREGLKGLEYALPYGSGGVRQLGRLLFVQHTEEFLARVSGKLHAATAGLDQPEVEIHIFTGLGGGTGSGCFLDACYLLRQLLGELCPGLHATLSGYCFLPDVNLSRFPPSHATARAAIAANGCAAMEELDHCMGLGPGGETFTQAYPGGRLVPWAGQPVDLCRLIPAAPPYDQAYRRAISAAAAYVLDRLTETAAHGQPLPPGPTYQVIGGTCAALPRRELDTRLAAGLFARFAQAKERVPGPDGLQWAASLLDYPTLLRQLRDGIAPLPFPGDRRMVKSRGEAGEQLVLDHYEQQARSAIPQLEERAKALTASLLRKLSDAMDQCCGDLDRGPFYLLKLAGPREKEGLSALFDRLLAQNRDFEDRAFHEGQEKLHSAYVQAREAFFHALPLSDLKRYQEYLALAEALAFTQRVSISCLEEMDRLLKALRDQVRHLADSRFRPLCQVLLDLDQTFQQNASTLSAGQFSHTGDFTIPLATPYELQSALDQELDRADLPHLFRSFTALLLEDPGAWEGADGAQLCRLVSRFFTQTAFPAFSRLSLAQLLQEKYGGAFLPQRLFQDYLLPLAHRSAPAFPLDEDLWGPLPVFRELRLSAPAQAAPAAALLQQAEPNVPFVVHPLPDRIYMREVLWGVPLGACPGYAAYEGIARAHPEAGRHLYEGAAGDPSGRDWRKLPSLLPGHAGA